MSDLRVRVRIRARYSDVITIWVGGGVRVKTQLRVGIRCSIVFCCVRCRVEGERLILPCLGWVRIRVRVRLRLRC